MDTGPTKDSPPSPMSPARKPRGTGEQESPRLAAVFDDAQQPTGLDEFLSEMKQIQGSVS